MHTHELELEHLKPPTKAHHQTGPEPEPEASNTIHNPQPVIHTIKHIIFLGMKQTALVDDNEVWREYYEAEFGVPGISSSSAPPL